MCRALAACMLDGASADELAATADQCVDGIERATSGMLDRLEDDGVSRADMASHLAAMNTRCEHRCGDIEECYRSATFMTSPFVADAKN